MTTHLQDNAFAQSPVGIRTMHLGFYVTALILSIFSLRAYAIPSESEASLGPEIEIVNLETASRPTVSQAAVQARKLLLTEKISTLSTVFPSGEKHGLDNQPIGLMDYYADCSEDGNPTLLAIKIATSFRNAANGSSISLSIRKHAEHEFFSPAAHPRLSLIGQLKTIPSDSPEAQRLKKCFISRHPDARLWTPGNKIHESEWMTMEISSVYWIGGFGNVAYIGWIPLDLYKSVKLPFDDVQNVIEKDNQDNRDGWSWRKLFVQTY